MNFIEDTKEKVKAAKVFFQKKAKPIASMAAVGLGAVLLNSCATNDSNFNSFPTRQSVRVTQTMISEDGRSRTTTSQYQEQSRYEEARARREEARARRDNATAAKEWARALKETRNAFKGW